MKISIITACYNSEKTISRTIESILNQTYQDIELIVIDGDSSDDTLEKLNNYSKNISFMISERDNGIYDALNKGLKQSNGDIIAFLHSDDFYPNNKILENVINQFKINDKVDIVLGDIAFIDNNKNFKRFYSGENFNFNYGIMPPHPSTFIKKKYYNSYGNFNLKYKIASDYDLLFRFIILNKAGIRYSNNILVYMKPGGKSNKNIYSIFNLNKEIYDIHKSHNKPIRLFNLLRKIPIRLAELIHEK